MKTFFIIIFIFLTSCGSDNSYYTQNGLIMIGTKKFKVVHVKLDGSWVTTIIPADSSISIIPDNVTYQNGKTTTTTVIVQ